MVHTSTSETSKKLVMRFILENIDYRKRCQYLQEIISLSRIKDVWRQALISYFDSPMNQLSITEFSPN
ncbi:MAG: hypothetical protein E6H09_02870 [Bacteroidetes bacterium]|jgi:hypothetical protein|nr:MAG: hypothetical protein E6H09_02870 [Bacteroidota bacterium]